MKINFDNMKTKPETPKVGVGVVLRNKEGKILLMLRKGSHGAGMWSLPGGHMELGETFFDVCRREVMEEVNIPINRIKQIGFMNDIFVEEGLHYVTLFFESEYLESDKPVNMEPDRCDAIQWFTVKEIENLQNVFIPLLRMISAEKIVG